eukprot:jgi/Undpi1/4455/HiC_scaffold_17.g07809.m1
MKVRDGGLFRIFDDFLFVVIYNTEAGEYKEDNAVVTKNAFVVVKRVPALKTGGLLAKMKALDAAAALQSTATATSADFEEGKTERMFRRGAWGMRRDSGNAASAVLDAELVPDASAVSHVPAGARASAVANYPAVTAASAVVEAIAWSEDGGFGGDGFQGGGYGGKPSSSS